MFPGAPTIYASILDHPERDRRDLSSLRLAVTGAAVVPVALVERMRAELSFDSVLTAYGLTEAVVVTMCRPGDDPETVATTSGRATAGFEIRIAPAGHGADQPVIEASDAGNPGMPARTGRRDLAARPERDARLPRRPRRDRRGDRRRAAGCTPATSAVWTSAAT